MSKLATLGKNTVSNFGFFFVSKALALVNYAVLVRFIGLEEYGLLLLVSTLLGRLNFLQGGLGTALEKYIPKYLVGNQLVKLRNTLSTTLIFFVTMGLGLSVFFILTANSSELLNFFGISQTDDAINILYISAALSPLAWVANCLLSAIKGYNQHHYANVVENLGLILSFLIMSALALLDIDIIWIFIAMQLPILLMLVLFSFKLQKLLGTNPFQVVGLSTFVATLKEIFSYSVWVFLIQFSSMLINQLDRILVSTFVGIGALPIYVGIVQLMKTLTQINGKLNSAVVPIAAELNESKSIKKFNEIGYRGTKITNSISSPITLMVVVFAEPILLLLGKEHLIDYIHILHLGVIAYMIISSKSFFQQMFIGSGNVIKQLSVLSISSAACYLFLMYFLTPTYQIKGAILALPITHLIFLPIWFVIAKKFGGVEFIKLCNAILSGQAPSVLVIFSHLVFYWTIGINDFEIMYYVVYLVVVWPLTLFLIYKYSIEQNIKDMVRQKFTRFNF